MFRCLCWSSTARESQSHGENGSKGPWKPVASTSKSHTRAGLLLIHFVAECEWSILTHRAGRAIHEEVRFSSGRCRLLLDEDPTVITQRVRETIEE
jgi:hypothetical protein